MKSVLASGDPQDDQKCISLSGVLKIPDDGSWVQLCWADPSAPEAATITETNLKLLIDHPNPGQLEIQLTRSHSDIIKTLSPEAISKEGIGLFPQIRDFNGTPSMGEWIVRIRDTVPGTEGNIQGLSIACLYSPDDKMPLATSKNGGKPSVVRIAADAVKISVSPDPDEKKESTKKSTSKTQLNPVYSAQVLNETFEEVFPPTVGWSIYDGNPNDGMEYFWDDDDFRILGSLAGKWRREWNRSGSNDLSGEYGYLDDLWPF